MQQVHIYSTYSHMTSAWFWVHISTVVYLKSVPRFFSSSERQPVVPLENSALPVDPVRQDIVVKPASFRSSRWAEFHPSPLESQSRDFDNVGASWACGGLDARGRRVTRGWRRPPLGGPVEAITVGSQCWGCWEADDSCCNLATFAVDPVIGFEVEVWTTKEEGKSRETMNNIIYNMWNPQWTKSYKALVGLYATLRHRVIGIKILVH